MKFTASQGRTVEWFDGEVTGYSDLVDAVRAAVNDGVPVAFNFWGEREASIATEFDAYITIGSVIASLDGNYPEVDIIPDNPDGYVPEGPIFDDDAEPAIVAAAARYFNALR